VARPLPWQHLIVSRYCICEILNGQPLSARNIVLRKSRFSMGLNFDPIFRHLWTISSPDYVSRRRRDRSLQRRFPIVPGIFAIEVRSRPKSRQKACFFPNFFGRGPQILDLVFKIAPISDHVAKFRGDRPRDRGDLELTKKRQKKNSSKT